MLVSEAPPRERTVRAHIDCGPLSLDPARATDYSAVLLLQALTEPLCRIGADGIELAAAESLSHNDEGTRWAVKLRPDLAWSDGTPITSDDFVRAFRTAAAPEASPLARAVAGELLAGDQSGVERVFRSDGPDRLLVAPDDPVPWVPALLASTVLAPRLHEAGQDGERLWSGPYCLRSSSLDRVELVSNSHWRGGAGRRPPIEFAISRDLHAPLDQFAAGELDITCSTFFPVERRSVWRSRGEYRERESSIGFALHVNPAPLGDDDLRAARRALSRATSSRAVARGAGHAVEPWRHFVPSFLAHGVFFDDGDPEAFDPVSAAAELPSAVRELGELRLIYPDYYPNGAVAEELARMWRSALALEVRPVPVELSDYVDRFERRDFELALGLWSPAVPDALATLSMALRVVGDEQIAAANDAFEAGSDDASLIRTLDRILHLDPPFVPIAQVRHRWLQSPRLSGYKLSASSLDVAGLRWT